MHWQAIVRDPPNASVPNLNADLHLELFQGKWIIYSWGVNATSRVCKVNVNATVPQAVTLWLINDTIILSADDWDSWLLFWGTHRCSFQDYYRIPHQASGIIYDMYNDNSPHHFHRIITCISTTPKAAAGYPRRNVFLKYLAQVWAGPCQGTWNRSCLKQKKKNARHSWKYIWRYYFDTSKSNRRLRKAAFIAGSFINLQFSPNTN